MKSKVFHTRNKCNEFLVCYLIKKRGKMNLNVRDNKFFVYTSALESIKKYPLPIICSQQLKILKGIGQVLTNELTSLIKQHYKKYLKAPDFVTKTKQQQEVNQTQKQQPIAFSQNLDNIQNCDSISMTNLSIRSETKAYKPRVKTLNYKILKVMKQINAIEDSITKADLKRAFEERGMDKIARWEIIKNTLLNSGYIQRDAVEEEEEQRFFLTQKGDKLIEGTFLKVRIEQQVSKTKQSYEVSQCLEKYAFEKQEEQKQQNKIVYNQKKDLILLIDSRQIKDASERDFFQQKLTKKYHIQLQTVNLGIGDFAWMYDGYILSYIVERKKADDLASSILDGRYDEQKYRLQNTGAECIFYLYEGHPSDTCSSNTNKLENALLNTRFRQGFKVVKTKAVNESAMFLAEIHKLIYKKLKDLGELPTLGTLERFNKKNGKNKNLTVEDIFGQSLKLIPKVGKETVNNILKYFKTFSSLYQKLSQFKEEKERVEYLNTLLKGTRVQSDVSKIIVNMLFRKARQE